MEARAGLEEHLNNRDSIQRLRLDMFDVIDGGGKVSFRDGDNAIGHVLRDETVVVPDDADDWNIDRRKNISGSPNNREAAHDQDQDRHHHKCVGSP